MIQGMFDYGATPVLERLVQFTAARHEVLADNVANLSTPYFKPRDLDPASFQETLARAVDRRRSRPHPLAGPLELRDTRQLGFSGDTLTTRPTPRHENILFHDRNNRDLERLMQDVAENTMIHNGGIEMLRNKYNMLRTAIRERVA